ncbi:hypothetical protein F4827_006530 [Paraburkholderia bannensis]|uniref:Uncharacterized protein n=1 Tax=Paraburkholderia bannensis TaxID=765414 RepID=A0A7W9U449_9BURK|nr:MULTISPECIES: hypothetical protein [Paraburkholderia]MBB3261657.1 hypothetical protein [Paraburkholderia sp. WP4_3_2]MBB6106654.1 hypothetical protein [Paraburkholderia bannensis]
MDRNELISKIIQLSPGVPGARVLTRAHFANVEFKDLQAQASLLDRVDGARSRVDIPTERSEALARLKADRTAILARMRSKLDELGGANRAVGSPRPVTNAPTPAETVCSAVHPVVKVNKKALRAGPPATAEKIPFPKFQQGTITHIVKCLPIQANSTHFPLEIADEVFLLHLTDHEEVKLTQQKKQLARAAAKGFGVVVCSNEYSRDRTPQLSGIFKHKMQAHGLIRAAADSGNTDYSDAKEKLLTGLIARNATRSSGGYKEIHRSTPVKRARASKSHSK